MTKHIFPFIAAFMVGCVAALAARSALHNPHERGEPEVTAAGYSQMVTNPGSPAVETTAGHLGVSTTELKTVNTVCAICGMDVDPAIEPATYQGKLVGFGCRMCPPKFAREPDLYGPAALENKTVAN